MMHHDPELIAKDSLSEVSVGVSVSDSADLKRLGLDDRHLDLAVGEIARAVLIAGGIIVYGGRLHPSGFTQQLMNEVERYGTARHSLTLCVALPEHLAMSEDELGGIDAALGTAGRLVTLDIEGNQIRWQDRDVPGEPLTAGERVAAYSGLRRHMATITDGRIIVGGRLRGFKGKMPGVIEEVLFSIEAGHPVYLAGGFGGAAAAVARHLDPGSFEWLPDGLPEGATDDPVQQALERVAAAATEREWTIEQDGLSTERRALLGASHRPGDVASLSVLGLADQLGNAPGRRG